MIAIAIIKLYKKINKSPVSSPKREPIKAKTKIIRHIKLKNNH